MLLDGSTSKSTPPRGVFSGLLAGAETRPLPPTGGPWSAFMSTSALAAAAAERPHHYRWHPANVVLLSMFIFCCGALALYLTGPWGRPQVYAANTDLSRCVGEHYDACTDSLGYRQANVLIRLSRATEIVCQQLLFNSMERPPSRRERLPQCPRPTFSRPRTCT